MSWLATRACPYTKTEEEEEDDAPDEVFMNPFGKWEISKTKKAKLEAVRAEEAAERRANRGPTWGRALQSFPDCLLIVYR